MAGLRATDQNRDSAVETIEDAYAKGQLNDAERESRTQRALQATTLGELQVLVSDLQPDKSLRVPHTSVIQVNQGFRGFSGFSGFNRRIGLIVASIGIACAGLVGAIGIFASTSVQSHSASGGSPDSSSVDAPEVKGNLLTVNGLTRLIASANTKFGTAVVSDAVVYSEYASFTVPVAGNPRHTEDWSFRGTFDDKARSVGNRGADDTLIDLNNVDVNALMDWVKKAGTELNVKDVDTTYLIFDARDDKPSMSVYVSNKFHDTGYASLNLDGSVLYVYKFQ